VTRAAQGDTHLSASPPPPARAPHLDEIWVLLAKGGMGSAATNTDPADTLERRYDALRDPAGAEMLAAQLAAKAGRHDPTLIVVWDDVVSAVLGYAVAARLNVPVVRTYDHEGLIRYVGSGLDGAVAVIVADRSPDEQVRRATQTLLERNGGRLAAAVSLVGDAPVEGDSIVDDCLVGLVPADTGDR
jgi:hypothetical protein